MSGSSRPPATPAAPWAQRSRPITSTLASRACRAQALDGMSGAYLGPEFSQQEIDTRLAKARARFTTLDQDKMLDATAQALAKGSAVGWFQGRMEFGPRALGNRSIFGDPRSPAMQKNLNLKVKYRESFRPFAPSVLRDHVADWFELDVG